MGPRPRNCSCSVWKRAGFHARLCAIYNDGTPSRPTLAEACEVIEALLTHWSPLTSDEDVREARAFLARVKAST